MTDPIQVAVVGHTNAGKTSLLRTLTRHSAFGDVSDRPGTTRHVEAIDLKVNGASAVRFYDTPGLEDSTTLLDYLESLDDCPTRPDRVRAFLKGPEARASFEQEAKVLRKMLEVEAGFYVIDTREPVLPKFHAEVEILTSCAKPIMPVLNFVRHQDSRKEEWLAMLSANGLHAYVQFDAVAPFVGSEKQLYQDLATLLRERRAQLSKVVEDLEAQRQERQAAGCRLIADLLVSLAALRREIPREDFEVEPKREAFIQDFRSAVLAQTRHIMDELLLVYGFRKEDADSTDLPMLAGRWENDLFNPESILDASKKLGTGAAVGAAIGLVADIAVAGMSLGAASVLGATLGGLASQGWGQVGRKIANKARGVQELTLENAVLLIVAERMLDLLWVLEHRGHAAMGKIAHTQQASQAANEKLKDLIDSLQTARSHPEWEARSGGVLSGNAARSRFVDTVSRRVNEIASKKDGDTSS